MRTLTGLPASPGVAFGVARVLHPISLQVQPQFVDPSEAEGEWARYCKAVEASARELNEIKEKSERKGLAEEAEIFSAHLLMLEDPEMEGRVGRRTREERLTAESAVGASIIELAGQFEAMEDEFFSQRAIDVKDVGCRILKNLMRPGQNALETENPGILLAEELLPSDAALLDDEKTIGIATEKGGAASHASIIARSLGIPCVVGIRGLLELVDEGEEVVVDGTHGELHAAPDPETKARLEASAKKRRAKREAAWKKKSEPAVAADGRRIAIYANAASVDDVGGGMDFGGEGVGLFRTEFLFLDRLIMPSEEEQTAVYRSAARAAQGKPVAIRLLDIGGDKPANYLKLPHEANPFLGLRSIRLLLQRPEVLRAQVRAILRAAGAGDVSILVPMVSDVSEIEEIKKIIGDCREQLEMSETPPPPVPLGAMIETPAAALQAARLAKEVDYFSVGTNDLTQYCMAADRGNAAVAHLCRATHPAVLELIRLAAEAAHAAGIKIGVCGEAAAEEEAIPGLLALGVDSLSVSPVAIPETKEIVRNAPPNKSGGA